MSKVPFFRSLPCYLLILALLALAPATGLIFLGAIQERRQAVLETQNDLQRLVLQTAREYERIFQSTQQLLAALAEHEVIRQRQVTACEALIKRILPTGGMYNNLGAAAPDGEVFCSLRPLQEQVNIADRAYFQEVLRTKAPQISGLIIGRISGLPALIFAYPAIDNTGAIQAIVFASLDMAWLTELASQVTLPPDAVLAAINPQGVILARHPNSRQWAGVTLPPEGLLTAIRQQGRGTANARGVDGKVRLYVFAPIGPVPLGYVYAGTPLPEVYQKANRLLSRNLAGLGIIFLTSLSLTWFFSQRWLLRPVASLTLTASRLAARDYQTRVAASQGPTEIRLLGQVFDQLAVTLAERDMAQQQMLAQLTRLNRLYLVRSRVNEVLVRATQPEELYELIVQIATREGGFRSAWIGVVTGKDQQLVQVAQSGLLASSAGSSTSEPSVPLLTQTLALKAVREGRLVIAGNQAAGVKPANGGGAAGRL